MIYVVDDDKSFRTALTRLLEAVGYVVRPYASAEDFLSDINGLREGCMILDINLPGANGFELQEGLIAKGIRLPTVFLTGSGDAAMGVRAMNSGAVEFLAKPVDAEVLLAAIRKALACEKASRT